MISKLKYMNKVTLIILAISIVFFSCNSEKVRNEEIEKENEARKKESIINAEKYFIEKYNPITHLDKMEFRYSYDFKKLFNDTTDSKLVLIKNSVDDFDITDTGEYLMVINQGYYPSITFIIYCTKNQFENIHQDKRVQGVFVVKIKRVGSVWFDLEADGEDIIQSFTNDLIAFGDLIDYKIIE